MDVGGLKHARHVILVKAGLRRSWNPTLKRGSRGYCTGSSDAMVVRENPPGTRAPAPKTGQPGKECSHEHHTRHLPRSKDDKRGDTAKTIRMWTHSFHGADGLYDRHLLFDNVADLTTAGARQRYEAFARSVRDVLSQRWILTEKTYESENPKRAYYLSMEFLLGRSLANNLTNLLLDQLAARSAKEKKLTGSRCSSRSPTPAWEMVDLAGWPRASSTPWLPCNSLPWVTACATNTASSGNPSRTDGSTKKAITGCAMQTPGR